MRKKPYSLVDFYEKPWEKMLDSSRPLIGRHCLALPSLHLMVLRLAGFKITRSVGGSGIHDFSYRKTEARDYNRQRHHHRCVRQCYHDLTRCWYNGTIASPSLHDFGSRTVYLTKKSPPTGLHSILISRVMSLANLPDC